MEYWLEYTPQGRWEIVTLERDPILDRTVETVVAVFDNAEDASAEALRLNGVTL